MRPHDIYVFFSLSLFWPFS